MLRLPWSSTHRRMARLETLPLQHSRNSSMCLHKVFQVQVQARPVQTILQFQAVGLPHLRPHQRRHSMGRYVEHLEDSVSHQNGQPLSAEGLLV